MNRKYEKWYMRGRDILITATAVQSWKKKRKERKEEKNERSIDFEGLKRVLPMPRGSRYKKCTPIPRSAYFNVFILPYESSSLVASCLLNALKRTLPPPRDTLVSNVSAISKTTPTFLSTFQVCTVIAEDTRMPGRTNLSCRFEIRNLPRMNLSLFFGCALNIIFSFLSFFPSYRNVI